MAVCAAVVRYSLLGKPRTGVCTTYLQDQMNINEACPVFISENPDFRLPKNGDIPIIMIGPGTGIAPFRAFIQERGMYTILYHTICHAIDHSNDACQLQCCQKPKERTCCILAVDTKQRIFSTEMSYVSLYLVPEQVTCIVYLVLYCT